MYRNTYIYTHTYIHKYIHTYIHIYICTYTYYICIYPLLTRTGFRKVRVGPGSAPQQSLGQDSLRLPGAWEASFAGELPYRVGFRV